ncbi:MAG: class I SAM-dependent methyltransferase, partial [Anaerolineales bacterium]
MNNIEILSTSLLDQHRPLVQALKKTAASLGLEFGWHYLLDLTWIISQLGELPSKQIMDAGAGTGVMQWYLASQGADATSVDRASRADLPLRFRSRYQVSGQRSTDLHPPGEVLRSQFSSGQYRAAARSLGSLLTGWLARKAPGSITIYNQDLRSLTDLPDNSFDAVVAVSSLEHNPPDNLAPVVQEMMRVIKPGGLLLATLGAGRDHDWYHEPSQGWCYTAASLRKAFDLPADTPDNYRDYDELFNQLKNNTELSTNLASFYARSGKNGMPWGKWDPQYQPVGVRKVK